MRADELLTEIEPLAYRERCGRLAGLRRSADDPALAGLLDELAARGHYERSLALFVAAAVRDEASRAHIERAMRDPDARLAAEAITLAARFGLGAEDRWDAPASTTADPATAEVIDGLADRCAGTGVLAVLDVAAALAQAPDDPHAVWSPPRSEPDPGAVLPHAERLAGRGDLSGGMFACALAGRHAERAGWPEEWRALLRRLRAHGHPDVSYAARRIRTAPE